ncbi:MAG: hypothetical protein WCD80_13975 [Desulfobaccales bacterium]
MSVEAVLKAKFPYDIVDALLNAYGEIEENFVLKKWKASELDAGHFVEAARRILEFDLTGIYTPISQKLPNFSDTVLKSYENASGDESFRILIPRALKAIYNIRNKRGVGHISDVSPNEMDSTYILYTVKWVLAELVRLASGLTVPETQKLIESITERKMDIVWKEIDFTRILHTSIIARDKILILLYDQSPRGDKELQAIIEYSNKSKFKGILRALHKQRLIEYKADGLCIISPTGLFEAEAIALKGFHA